MARLSFLGKSEIWNQDKLESNGRTSVDVEIPGIADISPDETKFLNIQEHMADEY